MLYIIYFFIKTTALLSGHFLVDVYDQAYATALAGIVGFKTDIVYASICYRGHVEYDLNVLKVRPDYSLRFVIAMSCLHCLSLRCERF